MSVVGWDERWAAYLRVAELNVGAPTGRLRAGRVIAAHRGACDVLIVDEAGIPRDTTVRVDLEIPGNCRGDEAWPPVVGDWVALDGTDDSESVDDSDRTGVRAFIVAILPRRTYLTRPAVGRAALEQPICANIDVVLIVEPALPAPSRGRIERFIALALSSGARPWLVLTKADLEGSYDMSLLGDGCEEVAAVDARSEESIAPLADMLDGTVVLVGRSGAGKSTLANTLLGVTQAVGAVRESDYKGRHTTTRRQLISGENFALVDTPGVRALGATTDMDAIDDTFADIAALAESCHFSNCRHGSERGCAVQQACADGNLDPLRLERYLRMMGESERLRTRSETRTARHQERRASKENTRGRRETMRLKGKKRG